MSKTARVYFGVLQFLSNGFIVLDTIPIKKTTSIFVTGNSSSSSSTNDVKWHARLGHIRQDCLKRLAKASLLGSIDKIDLLACEQCLAGKATRLPFGKSQESMFSFRPYSLRYLWPNECEDKTCSSILRHFYR